MKIIRSRAPLRISFAGGGTDVSPYPETHGGAVLSTTIDRYAYVTIYENHEGHLKIISQDYDLVTIFENLSELKFDGKLDLIKATLKHLQLEQTNLDIILNVDSPPGSGLGSSAAITVALTGALCHLKNTSLTPYELADTACIIEYKDAGIKGGVQDQYASTFGGFNFIEFYNNKVVVNPLRLRKEIQNELLSSLILCDTKKTRLSAKILERQIESYKQKNNQVIQNLDHIKQLAHETKESMIKGDIYRVGELLDQSWQHKKKLDKEISNQFIDKVYLKAKESGAIGGKLLGAGGGGHFLFVCDIKDRITVVKELEKLGCSVVKFNFDIDGLQVWNISDGKVIS